MMAGIMENHVSWATWAPWGAWKAVPDHVTRPYLGTYGTYLSTYLVPT